MKDLDKLNVRNIVRAPRSDVLVMLLGAAAVLAGCGGGGGDNSPPPVGTNPPPVPAPPPSPPPPPASTVPPQAATAIDLDDNHQVGVDHWPNGPTTTGGNGDTVQGIPCRPAPIETYHVHTHLSIFLNGEALSVPPRIGIVAPNGTQCIYDVHTHDKSGKIHVESTAEGMFTLGQLFAIWGQELTDTNVADLTGNPITVYVTDDGVVTEAEGDWHDIELKSHREITVVVGTAISEIPNFTWSAH